MHMQSTDRKVPAFRIADRYLHLSRLRSWKDFQKTGWKSSNTGHQLEAEKGYQALLCEKFRRLMVGFHRRMSLPWEAEKTASRRAALSAVKYLFGRDERTTAKDERVCMLHAMLEESLLLRVASWSRWKKERKESRGLSQVCNCQIIF